LEAGDVGHRVVVRHRTPAGPTDVLGELAALDDDQLVVRTEAGDQRRIARADVVAGKRVGPRPARYSEILELERIADRAWPAPEVLAVGQWRLRYADGWTNRANSALPLGEAGRPLAEAVEECVRFYTDRGAVPKITVPLPVRRDVAAHLAAAGWVGQPVVLVQTAPLTGLAQSATAGAERVVLSDRPSPQFLELAAVRKRSLPAAARHVLCEVSAVRFAEVRHEPGDVLAIARGAVVDQWLHIGLVDVLPHARRQGLARALSAALAVWAGQQGATRALLQVEERNTPAVRLYASLGFGTHHTYVTYQPRDAAGG
jgi:ribosomal protein S18 acetylase RimI-like enzyme